MYFLDELIRDRKDIEKFIAVCAEKGIIIESHAKTISFSAPAIDYRQFNQIEDTFSPEYNPFIERILEEMKQKMR